MDWKLEGSAQETESHVLQEQEVTLEDTGEDGISESFQLLQIDVECEHREEMTLPTSNAVWRSGRMSVPFYFRYPAEHFLRTGCQTSLEDVDLNKVYILGGLVDESIQKKVTFQKAQEHSVKTARLPIQEYMVRRQNGKNYHSEILAINQVFDILSTYFETQNWPEALKKGVSSRKGYTLQNSVE
ncbi:hypothetical protein J1605_018943 [Eschrichtius robustus]|uniref:tRNA (guanine(9)-N(1))-methyltransferase n=1 Tax=Eschrichtius robustus TaxID=9764 RepID=A0AB34HU54_ESCRO|nr:hypothetical protein J1605_018943 [Eschrichtius robustus]